LCVAYYEAQLELMNLPFRLHNENLLAESQRVQPDFLYLELKVAYTLLQTALSSPPGADHYQALKPSIWKAIGAAYYFASSGEFVGELTGLTESAR
jgi:hypothetical protein